MSGQGSPTAEFSRQISAEQIGVQETTREIAANADERAKLAMRFGLLALDRLSAVLHLKRGRGGAVLVQGRFIADVTQACVVTLEPVPAHLEQDFTAIFAPRSAVQAGEVLIVLEEDEPPEEIVEGRIDLGEAVVQQFAVALDPYPRSPKAAEAAGADSGSKEQGRKGPFAALASWQDSAKKA
jgi:uncharacterized metal-binding protein YceD (DUF177 family)